MLRTWAVIAGFVVLAPLLQCVTIWLAARLIRVKNAGFRDAAKAYGIQLLANAAFGLSALATYYLSSSVFQLWVLCLLILAIASLVASVAAIRYALQTNWGQAMGAYIAQMTTGFALGLAFRLAIEGFVIPTNGMAPTVVGHHYFGVCPQCGGKVIVTAPEPRYPGDRWVPDRGICERCWKLQKVQPDTATRYSGDRILASKLENPRRWDLVVYGPPVNPQTRYLGRLVGFPGERVSVGDGALWINGRRLAPPRGLEKLRYIAYDGITNGAGEEPAEWHLGEDDYFVLGDNTEASQDSRAFGPVRRSALHSVAVAIYWPPDRMRLLRPDK